MLKENGKGLQETMHRREKERAAEDELLMIVIFCEIPRQLKMHLRLYT